MTTLDEVDEFVTFLQRAGYLCMRIQWLRSIMATAISMHNSSERGVVNQPLESGIYADDYLSERLKLIRAPLEDVGRRFTEFFQVDEQFVSDLDGICEIHDALSNAYISQRTGDETTILYMPADPDRLKRLAPNAQDPSADKTGHGVIHMRNIDQAVSVINRLSEQVVRITSSADIHISNII